MSKRIFTPEQIRELLQNPNVAKCSEKSIGYSKDFKLRAIKRYQEGCPPKQIFSEAGFNTALIGLKVPKWCLQDWLKIFNAKGEVGLKTDGRGKHKSGGRPKGIKHLSDKDKLKYLEAQVAYLKAENDFLAKLRKKS
jgi:transposase